MERSNYLGWIDLEMSGLDAQRDVILEIAALVTDQNLNIIAEGPSIVIAQPAPMLQNMTDFVRDLHTESGLIAAVEKSETSIVAAQELMLEFFMRYAAQGTMPLCGNSIWQDKFFLLNQMPKLANFFHYRIVDVSSIKELVARWYGGPEFAKSKNHRALQDIYESVAELKFYRANYFI